MYFNFWYPKIDDIIILKLKRSAASPRCCNSFRDIPVSLKMLLLRHSSKTETHFILMQMIVDPKRGIIQAYSLVIKVLVASN